MRRFDQCSKGKISVPGERKFSIDFRFFKKRRKNGKKKRKKTEINGNKTEINGKKRKTFFAIIGRPCSSIVHRMRLLARLKACASVWRSILMHMWH